MNIENHIEAILFLKGEPMSFKNLAKILEVDIEEIKTAADSLRKNLSERGIRLMEKDGLITLATAPESSKFTESLVKDEFDSELSKAAVETISIIIYKGPISRADIDYIRGVNSAFSVRNLLVKGLIEKETNPRDSRSYLYKPSFKLLQYLGIQNIKDLPEHGNFNEKIEEFMNNNDENIQKNNQDGQKENPIGDVGAGD